jgi:hypothetical protein
MSSLIEDRHMPMHLTTIHFSKPQWEGLKCAAEHRGISASELLRRIVDVYLEQPNENFQRVAGDVPGDEGNRPKRSLLAPRASDIGETWIK